MHADRRDEKSALMAEFFVTGKNHQCFITKLPRD